MKKAVNCMAFFLALLAALCAENIPLALGLTGAAGLTLTTSQILKRLGIWAKKRAARCTTTERPMWKRKGQKTTHSASNCEA